MTYEELQSMDIGTLLDIAADARQQMADRWQAEEATLARLPNWDGQPMLNPLQYVQLKSLMRRAA
jgi:hypothetical protein